MKNLFIVTILLVFIGAVKVSAQTPTVLKKEDLKPMSNTTETIVLAGGCFWCMDAIFEDFRGVEKVESGYAGGTTENPTYSDVSTGRTGHAEVIRITFDPSVISLRQIITIFFHSHDPTTLNRQGNDVGTDYRSMILYNSEEQHVLAMTIKDEITQAHVWGNNPIVTEIVPLKTFYLAEDYHQGYYKNNPHQGYCSIVIAPKVQKIRKEYHDLLKNG